MNELGRWGGGADFGSHVGLTDDVVDVSREDFFAKTVSE